MPLLTRRRCRRIVHGFHGGDLPREPLRKRRVSVGILRIIVIAGMTYYFHHKSPVNDQIDPHFDTGAAGCIRVAGNRLARAPGVNPSSFQRRRH